MDEANLNFRAKQATFYSEGVQIARIEGDLFDQFLPLLETFGKACEKTPEQLEAESAAEIVEIDAQIAELSAKKEALSSKAVSGS